MFKKSRYPVLYLRDITMFPGIIMPLYVGRKKSVNAIKEAIEKDKTLLVLTQKDPDVNNPTQSMLYRDGCIVKIIQHVTTPEGTIKLLVEGIKKAHITKFHDNEEVSHAEFKTISDKYGDSIEEQSLTRTALKQFEIFAHLNKRVIPESIAGLKAHVDGAKIADALAGYLPLSIPAKQDLLKTVNVNERLQKVIEILENEIIIFNTESKIQKKVSNKMAKSQRDYYLREQLEQIKKELGEDKEEENEFKELEAKIKKAKLSKEAKEKTAAEFKKIKKMPPMSSESTVIRNYLDWMLDLPWGKNNKIKEDLKRAEDILNKDHYGLEKVKERILEYLAVSKRNKNFKGPILCLVGPPGVGKTSLGKSIAKATGRGFVRMSLGGVRDENEIRGHRRTYIGSMPGKILQNLKKVKSNNPVFMLDEIDKMGMDYRGDPASAMLEVLDPEQNNKFNDHYLEVDYDLSEVMFVATANSMDMPRPLLDRMEVINISGYTDEEKYHITKQHILPTLFKEHAVKASELSINKNAIMDLIHYYTREAGVRNLKRELANIIRKSIRKLEGDTKKISITTKNLKEFAGIRKYTHGEKEDDNLVGITNGLAYTQVGGDILQIEAVKIPGKGKTKVTGKLGDVMQESVQAAESYVRSQCLEYGITPPDYQNKDIHIHVPEGATPKDGPSAGVAMCVSIVSVLTDIPVKKDVAMTGEITLRGRVLPIGGLKEKLLGALRADIKSVLIPKDNVKDLEEIPDNIKNNLEIIPITHAVEALQAALVTMPEKKEWDEDAKIPKLDDDTQDNEARVTH